MCQIVFGQLQEVKTFSQQKLKQTKMCQIVFGQLQEVKTSTAICSLSWCSNENGLSKFHTNSFTAINVKQYNWMDYLRKCSIPFMEPETIDSLEAKNQVLMLEWDVLRLSSWSWNGHQTERKKVWWEVIPGWTVCCKNLMKSFIQ